MRNNTFRLKRGDTFRLSSFLVTDGDVPINITSLGIVIASALRPSVGGAVTFLTTTIVDQTTSPGEFVLELSPLVTAGLLDGMYEIDIMYSYLSGERFHTETFNIEVLPSVTPS